MAKVTKEEEARNDELPSTHPDFNKTIYAWHMGRLGLGPALVKAFITWQTICGHVSTRKEPTKTGECLYGHAFASKKLLAEQTGFCTRTIDNHIDLLTQMRIIGAHKRDIERARRVACDVKERAPEGARSAQPVLSQCT